MAEEPILSSSGLWKLYGPSAVAFLAKHGNEVDPDFVKQSGYIPAVCCADIAVYPSEILVIMGLSGSGKSTLVRLLSRLIEPTAGSINFEGIDLLGVSPKEMINIRRHKMGMVFQNFALLPHRTVLENVAFPLEVQGMDRVSRYKRAQELLSLVSLEERGGYYPRELSGGQQQRVGIARSLAVGPDLWFLDEPFSALDPLIRREMQDEFLRLQEKLCKTIIFITHDFDEAVRLADRIVIMYEGRVIQIGTPEELITQPSTDYVREFTKDISREKVLTVRSIMEPFSGESFDTTVHQNDKLCDVMYDVLRSEKDFIVLDDNDDPVGLLKRKKLIEMWHPEI